MKKAFVLFFIFAAFVLGAYLGSEEKLENTKVAINTLYWRARIELGLLPKEKPEWPGYVYDSRRIDLFVESSPKEGDLCELGILGWSDPSLKFHVDNMGNYISLRTYVFVNYRDPMHVLVHEYRIHNEQGVFDSLKSMYNHDIEEVRFKCDGSYYKLEFISLENGTYLYLN